MYKSEFDQILDMSTGICQTRMDLIKYIKKTFLDIYLMQLLLLLLSWTSVQTLVLLFQNFWKKTLQQFEFYNA